MTIKEAKLFVKDNGGLLEGESLNDAIRRLEQEENLKNTVKSEYKPVIVEASRVVSDMFNDAFGRRP